MIFLAQENSKQSIISQFHEVFGVFQFQCFKLGSCMLYVLLLALTSKTIMCDPNFFFIKNQNKLPFCASLNHVNPCFSYGYGFVQYQTPDDAAKAITQLNGLPVRYLGSFCAMLQNSVTFSDNFVSE